MDMASEESLEQLMQQGVEERKRQLRRHKLPERATPVSYTHLTLPTILLV